MSAKRMRDLWPGVHPAVKGLRIAGFVLLGLIGVAVFALVFGWLVMILWNWLMPAIFRLGVITYWQAFGIVILAKLIFGAPGVGRHGGPRRRAWKGGHGAGEGPHGEMGGRDRWRWYREFWEQEGKEAFERYVRQREAGTGAGTGAGKEAPGTGA